mgnify:CR=1 FL=1
MIIILYGFFSSPGTKCQSEVLWWGHSPASVVRAWVRACVSACVRQQFGVYAIEVSFLIWFYPNLMETCIIIRARFLLKVAWSHHISQSYGLWKGQFRHIKLCLHNRSVSFIWFEPNSLRTFISSRALFLSKIAWIPSCITELCDLKALN